MCNVEQVENMIFGLFEKKPTWSFKQIQDETKQPEPYLRSLLGKVAVYQKGGENQGLYELRPEYKHGS